MVSRENRCYTGSVAGVFADSFGHYNTAGIELKYSTVGGSLQNNPLNVRTLQSAPALSQSLEIQAGDAPTIINFTCPADTSQTYSVAPQFYNFAVGLAYKTGALNGTIFTLIRNLNISPSPPETLLYLVLNADGSLSLYTSGAVLVGSSAAGVISTGQFYYITLSADIGGFSETTFATVNVVNCTTLAAGVDVISVSGFTLIDQFIDEIDFSGPASPDHAWVNDFYIQDLSDGSTVPFAPNILACLPNADGTALNIWVPNNSQPWQPTSSAHFPLVNPVPEDESTGIQWNVGYLTGQAPQCAETLRYDCSGLPDGRAIQSIQAAALAKYVGTLGSGFGLIGPGFYFQQNSDGTPWNGNVTPFTAKPAMPFVFFFSENDVDPVANNPWLVSDWKSGVWQAGPTTYIPF